MQTGNHHHLHHHLLHHHHLHPRKISKSSSANDTNTLEVGVGGNLFLITVIVDAETDMEPDPVGSETFAWIRIRIQIREKIIPN